MMIFFVELRCSFLTGRDQLYALDLERCVVCCDVWWVVWRDDMGRLPWHGEADLNEKHRMGILLRLDRSPCTTKINNRRKEGSKEGLVDWFYLCLWAERVLNRMQYSSEDSLVLLVDQLYESIRSSKREGDVLYYSSAGVRITAWCCCYCIYPGHPQKSRAKTQRMMMGARCSHVLGAAPASTLMASTRLNSPRKKYEGDRGLC